MCFRFGLTGRMFPLSFTIEETALFIDVSVTVLLRFVAWHIGLISTDFNNAKDTVSSPKYSVWNRSKLLNSFLFLGANMWGLHAERLMWLKQGLATAEDGAKRKRLPYT